MSALLVLPILVPLASAAGGLLAVRHARLQPWIGVAGGTLQLLAAAALLTRVATAGIQSIQIGAWPAPFGITLVADHLGALLVLATAIVTLAALLHAPAVIAARPRYIGYYPLVHLLLAGVSGVFLAGDLFNLYVWFEVMLVASFVLLGLGGRPAQLDATVKYVAANLIASLAFLSAIGLLYGTTGTLNLAQLAVRIAGLPTGGAVTGAAALLLLAFGIKSALFPLFLWLSSSYHTAPIPIAALLAGTLTKVGVYGLIRMSTLLFTTHGDLLHPPLLVAAGVTMATGVLGAAAQTDLRRILSIHVVSQIGYLVMGIALNTPLALAGAVFYTVHVMLVKAHLFLLAGVMRAVGGSYDLERLGGLQHARPLLALVFLASALSLAGIPPLSGFWAKLLLVRAGLEAGSYAIVATALVVALGTLYSMVKIWRMAFWGPAPAAGTPGSARVRASAARLLPVGGLAVLVLAMGLWAEPLLIVAERAAAELLDPAVYIQRVLGQP